MKKKMLLLLSVGLLLTGCGSGSSEYTSDYASSSAYDGAYYEEAEVPAEFEGTGINSSSTVVDQNSVVDSSRKIIYSSNLTIETYDFDENYGSLKQLVNNNKGYFESVSIDGNYEYHSRCGYFTIRIPVNKYSEFMDSVGSIGNVTYKSESAEDVTSNYIDVNARISSLNKKMARLEALEDTAANLEDLLVLEDKINDTQYDIESYTSQLNYLKDKISYCTVDVVLNEVVEYTPVIEDDSFGKEVVTAIIKAWSVFIEFIQGLIIIIIYVFPFVLLGGIILLIVYFCYKSSLKRKGASDKKDRKEKTKELDKSKVQKENKPYQPVYGQDKNTDSNENDK